jgi:diguanylate cyclase (GGDEF)-like protein
VILTSEVRSQFTIFAFFQDIAQGSQMRTALAMEGYESFAFMDYDTCIERIRQSSPHIVIFNLEALMGSLSDFVEKVLEINPEIMLIPVVDATQAAALEVYREYNFVDLIPTGPELETRLKWTVDQVCSELFLTYQNEQFAANETLKDEQIVAGEKRVQELQASLTMFEDKVKSTGPVQVFFVREASQSYLGMGSKEDLVGTFFQRLGRVFPDQGVQALYLKYLPTVHNLVATQAMGLEIEQLKGVGAKLTTDEIQSLHLTLSRNETPPSVHKLMQQGFHVREYFSRGLLIHRGCDGLFLFWSKKSFDIDLLDNEFLIFAQAYVNFDIAKKFDAINFDDPVTEVQNREYYFMKLEEEVARSRRLQKAVSVVKVAFDDWEKILREGSVVRDTALRSLAILIKKSSRVNDLVCRTLDNEFAMVLPHSARKGAAIRSERLRRMIETHVFQYADRPMSISCGISEYPTFCSSAAELDHSAGQALAYIRTRGGNKVCLFRPTQTFKPDFDVPPI